MKDALASAYFVKAERVSLHTADPGSTGASEVSGGSPAYARKTVPAATLNGTGQGQIQVVFDVPAGTTVLGVGLWTAAGTFLDGVTVTSQTFSVQGTYTATVTYQQS